MPSLTPVYWNRPTTSPAVRIGSIRTPCASGTAARGADVSNAASALDAPSPDTTVTAAATPSTVRGDLIRPPSRGPQGAGVRLSGGRVPGIRGANVSNESQ